MEIDKEIDRLNQAVDDFAGVMKMKLELKAREGMMGWRLKSCEPSIKQSLLEHSARVFAGEKGQAVDVANLAMMVFFLEGKS